jgi:hypothetical protein
MTAMDDDSHRSQRLLLSPTGSNLGSNDWLKSDAIVAADDPPPGLSETLDWISAFVARPHVDLGRDGPVCPFIPRAIDDSTLYFRGEPEAVTLDAVSAAVDRSLGDFSQLPPTDPEGSRFKSLIMVFPAVSTAQAPELIDQVQKRRKLEFVQRGLMIGQFHAANNAPGAHNPAFRPLRSPVPLLVVRILVPQDLRFLTATEYSVVERLEFLEAYLTHLKSWPKSTVRERHIDELLDAMLAIFREGRPLDP